MLVALTANQFHAVALKAQIQAAQREQATRALQQEKDTSVWAVRLLVPQWVI